MIKPFTSHQYSDKSKMTVSVLLLFVSIAIAYAGTHFSANPQGSGSPFLAMLMVTCLYLSGLLYKSCRLSECET